VFSDIKQSFDHLFRKQSWREYYIMVYSDMHWDTARKYQLIWEVQSLSTIGIFFGAHSGYRPALLVQCEGYTRPDLKVPGVCIKEGGSKELIIMSLIRAYFILNNYFVSGQGVYRKNASSKYTYELVFGLDEMEKNFLKIFYELVEKFPMQLGLVSISHLGLERLSSAMNLIKGQTATMLPTVKLNYNLIEFTDGIYNKKSGMFLEYSKCEKEILENHAFNCYKYFNRSYKGEEFLGPVTGEVLKERKFLD
jgi:hypothetical protein